MIWFKKNYLDKGISKEIIDKINIVLDYINNNNMISLDKGSHEIEGRDIYVNILEYSTKDQTDCIWEAHREYLDLHYMISDSSEVIRIGSLNNMHTIQYHEEQDYVEIEGEADTEVILSQDGFLLLYPEDAHMTGVRRNDARELKKAVFKIKI